MKLLSLTKTPSSNPLYLRLFIIKDGDFQNAAGDLGSA